VTFRCRLRGERQHWRSRRMSAGDPDRAECSVGSAPLREFPGSRCPLPVRFVNELQSSEDARFSCYVTSHQTASPMIPRIVPTHTRLL